ncbi:uncharacterized protein PV06_05425 [Exophiala oligosperma]|uniref:Uncharacterized protein n=2 Tax=Chaetothyriales TaxID=34395 RepID=A0A0D2DFG4_9EURO|nr:uncharacterized protein PV06_05425 [Exophiala oligosperma]KAJ9643323.1 hypothetical protein H2204_002219 [Knufia peltigerae]KIW41818.1 hypothetical protein PV06_05425 [Exophiala oligosperma]
MSITTPLTSLLGIRHPILLAGMGQASGPALAAAVCNAGGLGVIGGVNYTPKMLRDIFNELKSQLKDPSLPFGVDLLLPQVGGNARKTNYDHTKGTLDALLDVIIESGCKVFVSAVGVPPPHIIDRLHKNGIIYMNMAGHPKHAEKACKAGADVIIAQGGEGGGHGADVPTSVLIPACADVCKKYNSTLTKQNVLLVAGGGIYDGRGLVAALALGASAVWVGTRFVTAKESGASLDLKNAILNANIDSTIKSTIWSGRPLRSLKTDYVTRWETQRLQEKEALQAKGVLPVYHDMETLEEEGKWTDEMDDQSAVRPMGVVSGLINVPNQSAEEIIDEIILKATEVLQASHRALNQQRAARL